MVHFFTVNDLFLYWWSYLECFGVERKSILIKQSAAGSFWGNWHNL